MTPVRPDSFLGYDASATVGSRHGQRGGPCGQERDLVIVGHARGARHRSDRRGDHHRTVSSPTRCRRGSGRARCRSTRTGSTTASPFAMSRPQGPVIYGAGDPPRMRARCGRSTGRRSGARDVRPAGRMADHADPRRAAPGRAGPVVRHRPNGMQTAYYDYDVWDPPAGTGDDAHDVPNGTKPTSSAAPRSSCPTATSRSTAATTSRPRRTPRTATSTSSGRRPTRSCGRLDASLALVLVGDRPAQRRGLRPGRVRRRRPSRGPRRATASSGCSPAPPRATSRAGTRRTSSVPTGSCSASPTRRCTGSTRPATASITSLGTFPTDNAGGTSTAVMFGPGRILQVGGGTAGAPAATPASSTSTVPHRRSRASAGPVRPALGERHRDGRRPGASCPAGAP